MCAPLNSIWVFENAKGATLWYGEFDTQHQKGLSSAKSLLLKRTKQNRVKVNAKHTQHTTHIHTERANIQKGTKGTTDKKPKRHAI